ncbi:hypothetical protein ES702_02414 [subsurface metagenome]
MAANAYASGVWDLAGMALVASALLALVDLIIWVCRKYEERTKRERDRGVCRVCSGWVDGGGEDNGGNVAAAAFSSPQQGTVVDITTRAEDGGGDGDKPKWPVRWIMILDFLMTGALLWMLVNEFIVVGAMSYGRYPPEMVWVSYYAPVPMAFAAVLHARCWWRQFRAREKQAWLRELGFILGIGWLRSSDDVKAGTERSVYPHAHCHGHGSGSSYQGRCACDSEGTNRILPIVQKRAGLADSVKETVKGLNREAMKALTSKNWLSDRSSTRERQALLARDRRPQTGCTQSSSNEYKKCACSHFHVCRSVGAESNSVAHIYDHEPVGTAKNDDVNGDSDHAHEVKPVTIDRAAAYLTPSDSGVTSVSCSTASSLTQSRGSRVGENKKEIKKEIGSETEVKDEDTTVSSALLPHGGRTPCAIDRDGGMHDHEDGKIMVVKKQKKKRAKVQKQRKGKGKEVDLEQ